jgi:predicted nuclease of restriction endonuclease-like (RecB) superfamily
MGKLLIYVIFILITTTIKFYKSPLMKPVKTTVYADIKAILEKAQSTAVRAVNFSMVMAYWQIGKRIIHEEQQGSKKANYGDYLIKSLSKKLTTGYGKGFTETNLKYFRQFYLIFSDKSIGHALRDQSPKKSLITKGHALRDQSMPVLIRSELSWTHYRMLVRIENADARNYYMNEAAEQNWSTRTLERQINSLYYQRLLSSKNKKALIHKTEKDAAADKPTILDFVKDPYILEFLQLNTSATLYEKELETELLNKLQLFLLELGKGFSFVARQKRVSAEGEDFFIDLVFYNYILKCFVLIDLKVGKLAHQDIGQMDLYVRYFEDQEKQPTDNPTIGIILCNEKNETIVKYSILKESKQLFASKYKLYLPTEKQLIAELNAEMRQLKIKKFK